MRTVGSGEGGDGPEVTRLHVGPGCQMPNEGKNALPTVPHSPGDPEGHRGMQTVALGT